MPDHPAIPSISGQTDWGVGVGMGQLWPGGFGLFGGGRAAMEPLCLYGKLTLCSLVLAAPKERSQSSSESLLLQAWQHSSCGTLARRSFLPALMISSGHFPSP